MKKYILSLFLAIFTFNTAFAQRIPDKELFASVCDSIKAYFGDRFVAKDTLRVQNVYIGKSKIAEIQFSNYLCDAPLRKNDIGRIYDIVRNNMPKKYEQYKSKFKIYSNESLLDDLASNALPAEYSLDSNIEIAKSNPKLIGKNAFKEASVPLVSRVSSHNNPSAGLQGRHIALWQSHGYYYSANVDKWIWQRPTLFGIVEDLYTQSYVVPFLVPMLENAGANVLLPRERDVQINEVIIDNNGDDNEGIYVENNGKNSWSNGSGKGFAPYSTLVHGQNPFKSGTYRVTKCVSDKESPSEIYWKAAVPQNGEYAVYVSYGDVDKATNAAQYCVTHSGGTSSFLVNQTMGAGTWIYLGTFGFDKDNENQGVYLSNYSNTLGKNVSADAVKFGGGMGVVARKPLKSNKSKEAIISGFPKFTEGATYWLQTAGFEEDVYNETKGKDDYRNDYMSRGLWVNALAGGSSRLPKETKGKHIPIDLSFAFHSDAGTTKQDSTIGTLMIYRRLSDGSRQYKYGGARLTAREYADLLQTQIISDIHHLYDSTFTRREVWDRSYLEARLPEVPSVLLELLSHQNFADMIYGLDPQFRFDVSRAVYKAILKYISYLNNTPYIVQPLPINSFEIDTDFGYTNMINLTWQPTLDELEKSAVPEGYIVYKRVLNPEDVDKYETQPDNSLYGFDEGTKVLSNSYYTRIEPGKIYSFKVSAINSGGESFPSEVLSVGMVSPTSTTNELPKVEVKNDKPTMLVINNYTRVAAPAYFGVKDTTTAGFAYHLDSGSPYKRDISYIGPMMEFRRDEEYKDDTNPGFGASSTIFADKVIAGNTFDFPLLHGAAIMNAGYNFVSSSALSLKDKHIDNKKYTSIDIICGKQVRTPKGKTRVDYSVFPEYLRNSITEYASNGGNILVSGAYIGTDSHDLIYDFSSSNTLDNIKKEQINEASFCEKVLRFKWVANKTSIEGLIQPTNGIGKELPILDFYTSPNSEKYCIESPDAIKPVGLNGHTLLKYSDGKSLAGVYSKSLKNKTVAIGFPIESLTSQSQINSLMETILNFFNGK